MTDIERALAATRGLTPVDCCLVLAELAAEVPAHQAIIEIGAYKGRSAIALGLGAQSGHGAHVWAVDPWDLPGQRGPFHQRPGRHKHRVKFTHRETRMEAKRNIHRNGLRTHVTMVRNFSAAAAASWDGPQVGLLYVDGNHNRDAVLADFAAWRPHMTEGAVVVFDDHVADDFQDVVDAVDTLAGTNQIQPVEVMHGRLAVTRLPVPEPGAPVPDTIAAESDGNRPADSMPRPTAREPVAKWRQWASSHGVENPDALTKAHLQDLDL